MNDKEWEASYNRVLAEYGFPHGTKEELNRATVLEWAKVVKTWDAKRFNNTLSKIIQDRQSRFFPKLSEVKAAYESLVPTSTDQPHRPLRSKIDLEIADIEDAIYNLPPKEKQAFRARLKDKMTPLLEALQPQVESPTRKTQPQPAILSAFSDPSPLMAFELRMQAVKLYAQEHGITLSRKINSIFNTTLPHRLSERDVDTRGMDVEQIDTELNAISQEIYGLAYTREKLWKKRHKIERTR